jgi:hypothetical protein
VAGPKIMLLAALLRLRCYRAVQSSTPRRALDRDLPGLAIALAVFGFSHFGDALRDVLDPKLRDR